MCPPERSTTPLSVAVVEDDDDMRMRIVGWIVPCADLRLAWQAASVREALDALRQAAPNVLLVDLGLPDGSGLEVIRLSAKLYPDCEVLVLSMFGDEEHVLPALEAGASGYLLKGTMTRDIALDIRELRDGGAPLSPIVARQVLKRLRPGAPAPAAAVAAGDGAALTHRESEILATIARGFSYAETAELLGISVDTVHSHLKSVYRKLAVHSKTEAVFEANRLGLIR